MDEISEMDDFFDGMGEDNHSDSAEEETETTETDTGEAEQGLQNEESAEDASEDTDGQEEPEKASEPEQEQTFTLRVNHEDKQVTAEEYHAFAQKGADYDRVKGQLEQVKNEKSGLQEKIDGMQRIVDIVNDLAAASNLPVDDLLLSFRRTRYTSQGYSEREADMALQLDDLNKGRAAKAAESEKENSESTNDRAAREIAEFQTKYPGVNITEELVNKLFADVQGGMTLTDAYAKMKDQEKDNQIRELQAQLAAEKQNAANRQSSPGSLKDSGRKPKRDQFDDFFDFFEKE